MSRLSIFNFNSQGNLRRLLGWLLVGWALGLLLTCWIGVALTLSFSQFKLVSIAILTPWPWLMALFTLFYGFVLFSKKPESLTQHAGGFPWVLVWSLLVVVFLNTVLRYSPAIQRALFTAADVRLSYKTQDLSFLREVIKIREEYWQRASFPTNGLILIGSSQMGAAVDPQLLSRSRKDQPVFMRALPGGIVFRMLGARHYWWVPEIKQAVLYVSELDIDRGSRTKIFSPSWLRPIISWTGLKDLLQASSFSLMAHHWHDIAELVLASACEGWALRDFSRHILFYPFGFRPHSNEDTSDRLMQAFTPGVTDPKQTQATFNALEQLIQKLKEAGAQVYVWEGELNPFMASPQELAWRPIMVSKLEALATKQQIELIDAASMPGTRADQWNGLLHLNREGALLMTEALACRLNNSSQKKRK